jgi:gluconolactonase
LDRYALPNENFVPVLFSDGPHSGPRRAERAKQTLPRTSQGVCSTPLRGYQSQSPWLVPTAFAFGVVLCLVTATLTLRGETVQAPKSIGQIVKEDARLDQVVAPGSVFEVIGSGFDWSEGPLWVKRDGFLLFSNIPPNSIMKWKPGEGVTLFMKPSGYTGVAPYGREPGSNGLTLDREGRLILAEHGDRRIARLEWNGGKRTLADNYQGKRLNSPNDVIVKSNGDIYFTDPIYGLPGREKDTEHRELDFCGVFRWSSKTGAVTLLTKELSRPNGLAFSPDEKTLYVANSDPERAIWMAYPVKDDGTIGAGKLVRDVTKMVSKELPGLPDGMKVDAKGTLFATGPGGVHVMLPDGTLLGRLETGQATSNCAWGEDGTVLFMTANMYVARVKTLTKGAGW